MKDLILCCGTVRLPVRSGINQVDREKSEGVLITINMRTSLEFKDIFGQWKFQVCLAENSTFKDLLKELKRLSNGKISPYIFEQDGKTLTSHIMFLVNGRNIRFLNKEKTILQDNDDVTILLPAGGG